MAPLVMYPAGTAMSPPFALLFEFVERVSHPLLSPDESVLVAGLRGLGYQHLVASLDQLAHIIECDQTIDPVSRLIRFGGEEIEMAAEQIPQPLPVGGDDCDEEALLRLVRHAVLSLFLDEASCRQGPAQL